MSTADGTPPAGNGPRRLTLGQQLLLSVHNFGLNFHWAPCWPWPFPGWCCASPTKRRKGGSWGPSTRAGRWWRSSCSHWRAPSATGRSTRWDAAAKDLGIWGISTTLPQVLGPLIGGPLLDAVNRLGPGQGYVAVNVLAAVYFVAGALAILKMRTR